MATSCNWSELPQDLLGLLIAGLPFPNDRARFRAVCRSWRSAMRHHAPQAQQQLVLDLPDGLFMAPSDGSNDSHPLPSSFPDDNTSCIIGSTNDWIALRRHDDNAYSMHNLFSGASVPLAGLGAIVDRDSVIRKVLMRSSPDDLIAIVTRDWDCPLILSHRGKDTWLPPESLMEVPYSFIIDVAFLEDKLYAITKAEDLMLIDVVGLRGGGKRMVVRLKRLIRQPFRYRGCGSDSWSVSEEAGLEAEERRVERRYRRNKTIGRRHHTWTYHGEEFLSFPDGFEHAYDDAQQLVVTVRYLFESRGKLLTVRHHVQIPPNQFEQPFTRGAEVFEAGVDAWVPVANGLGGGQALFVSAHFSKSVPAPCGNQIKEDTIYFVNTGEVFDMRSRTCSPVRWNIPIPCGTWVFPP
ncbi:hypothetical protein BRADI_1g17770v3 [Brachypodium distachyon]|uniref:F-box domain-containing protein n=1 Tax=Brachypodium distachyon TaxID=15368 RepID=I1GR56_BRADI|nr:hypothetical protein BRADI_1g17770v3 [Brachypodium distachyon]